MEKLLEAITDLISNTPPNKIPQLAQRVRELTASNGGKLTSWAQTPLAKGRIENLVESWRSEDISPEELSGMLIGASHAYHKVRKDEGVELVWTGPSTELVATRKTEQALLNVINTATKRLFLTSFVAYDASSIMTVNRRAKMTHLRG